MPVILLHNINALDNASLSAMTSINICTCVCFAIILVLYKSFWFLISSFPLEAYLFLNMHLQNSIIVLLGMNVSTYLIFMSIYEKKFTQSLVLRIIENWSLAHQLHFFECKASGKSIFRAH